jgi:type IV secretion system protein VirB10
VTSDPRATEKAIAEELRIRAEPPRVVRLSRKVLIGLGVVAGIGVAAALIVALQVGRRGEGTQELYSLENRPLADGLAALPRDYAGLPRDVPRLGPPLPGDLGRPILRAQEQGVPAVPPAVPPVQADAAAQRLAQEQEAARTSRLFVPGSGRAQTSVQTTATAPGAPAGAVPQEQEPLDEAAIQNAQGRRLAFLNAPVDRRTTSPDRLRGVPSPYVLQAGSVIPAALLTGLRSDLPGQVTAQVTEHVYDSPTGRHLLIPQGTRLIGQYDSQVSFGQSRVLLVWTRLILPGGRSIVLERQPGADAAGIAGLEDEVDYHWGRLFLAAGLATILGVGAELGSDADDRLVRALRDGSQGTFNQAGQQVVRRQLNVQPTLTIRPGFPVRVIVTRDLALEPTER